jgi:CHAT domain-containing protein
MKKLHIFPVIFLLMFIIDCSVYCQSYDPEFLKAQEFYNEGQYGKAAIEFEAGIPFVEKEYGLTDTTLLTQLLNFTGTCFQYSLQYQKAEKYFLQAKSIFEQLHATLDFGYSCTLNNLACLYETTGRYEQAEPLYLQCLEIDREQHRENDTTYTIDLNNLATFYLTMGRLTEAEPVMIQAVGMIKKQMGENHAEYGKYLNNLAQIYRGMGRYDQALPLMIKALEITKTNYGENHPQYAQYLNNLGFIYFLRGSYDRAEPLFKESLEIMKKLKLDNYPSYAIKLNNLANLYFTTGRYDEAEPLLLQAIGIDTIQLGKTHPQFGFHLNSLAQLYMVTGRDKEVEKLNHQAFYVSLYQINTNTGFLSAKELDQYLSPFLYNFEIYQSFNSQQIGKSMSTGEFAFDIELTRKGILLKSASELRIRIFESSDTSMINTYYGLLSLRKKISDLNIASSDKQVKELEKLQDQANDLEKVLALKSKDYRKTQRENNLTWKEIHKNLNPGEAAIEFSSFHFYNGKKSTDTIIYCAIVIRKQDTIPRLLYLCEESKLKKDIPLTLAKYSNAINSAYGSTGEISQQTGRSGNQESLYDLVWGNLDSLLDGINTVYYAPSGLLNSIAFAAVSCPDKKTLTEKYKLVQLSTTRTLASPHGEQPVTSAVVYGGIRYDIDDTLAMIATSGKYRKKEGDLLAYNASLPGVRSGFRYLPGTENEARLVASSLEQKGVPTTTFKGTEAVEESFAALSGKMSPSLIHLATHGFYYPDTISDEHRKKVMSSMTGDVQFKYSDDPLLRSGLLMAGSNRYWKGLSLPSGVEDGILTASEVSNMNLLNTQLVVLSACQTGLGDVKGSEGVEGLQRGFKMAGVRYLVMSLWEVPDKETTEFMTSFYDNWPGGKNIREAFRDTQLSMKNKYKEEPYKWAAFVLVE